MIKVEGIFEVQEMLLRLDHEGRRRVVSELFKAGQDTMRLAKAMAPVDEANLEKAIKMRPQSLGRIRDAYGRFARVEVEVYIDNDMPVEGRPGRTVGEYAYEIHEHLTPYGSWQLGERSQAKQNRSSGVQVGGGFFERAAEEVEQGMDKRLLQVLDSLGF